MVLKNNYQFSKILVRQAVNHYKTQLFWKYKDSELEAIF